MISPDLLNMDSIFENADLPQIFKQSEDSNIMNFEEHLLEINSRSSYEELLKMEYKIKPIDNFFNSYKTFYPFDTQSANKCFEKISSQGKFFYHEYLMLWFPDYYFLYKNSLETIMENKEGFLPLTWKLYLGIMAASTIRNEFLLRSLETEFLLNGGEEDWLIYGLSGAPEKLKKLEVLNNILAHQPWKLKSQNLKEICYLNMSFSWNIDELLQSVIIVTTFHRLATVLESLKITIKINEKNEVENVDYNKDENISSLKDGVNYNKIIKEASNYEEKNISENVDSETKILELKSEEGIKDKIINELEIMNKSNEQPRNKLRKNSDEIISNSSKNTNNDNINLNIDFSKYISKYCTVYLDFDSHSENYFSFLVIFKKLCLGIQLGRSRASHFK